MGIESGIVENKAGYSGAGQLEVLNLGTDCIKTADSYETDGRGSAFPDLASVPDTAALKEYSDARRWLLNGELRVWDGPSQKVFSPLGLNVDGQVGSPLIGEYPLLTGKEAVEALEAASSAYDKGDGKWPLMSSEDRIACVEKFLDLMVEKREEVVKLITWEIAKTRGDAEKEFDRTVEYVRDSIDALRAMNRGDSSPVNINGTLASMQRGPVGVTLCMGPFNYPLNETFTTLMPALLMGNTVVLKPPKYGVLLFDPLMEAFRDAFPAGVVNTVPGDGREVVTPMMQSGKVDLLAFIGSSQVADLITKQHPAPHRLRLILGLGAKNPAIILPDADLDKTVPEFVKGALTYNGQRCTALKIAFVHSSIARDFAERVALEVESLKKGMPWESGVTITPLAEDRKVEWMSGYVEDAVAKGARILNEGGGQSEHTLFTPAVLFPAKRGMKIFDEEQFGPVVPIASFDDVNEVIEYAKNSPYGQQASIFGRDQAEIDRLSRRLGNQVCRINKNTQCQRGPDILPFTGRKSSAMRPLSITDALKEFSIECVYAESAAR